MTINTQDINLFSTLYQPFSTLQAAFEQINFAVHHLSKVKMKKRNLFMSATIMCGLFAVAFTFKNDQITWLWIDNKPIAVILGIIAIAFGTFWIRHQKLLNKANN